MTHNWHVITAGPSAGKTSTLREIASRGYRTAPESARIVIDQAISEGIPADDVREELDFQRAVISKDREIENNIPTNERVFLDRGLADNIAYCRVFDKPIPDGLIDECRSRYRSVFLLEQLPFEADYSRSEDEKTARAIHNELRQTYLDLGYDVIDVPVIPIDERVDIIVSRIINND